MKDCVQLLIYDTSRVEISRLPEKERLKYTIKSVVWKERNFKKVRERWEVLLSSSLSPPNFSSPQLFCFSFRWPTVGPFPSVATPISLCSASSPIKLWLLHLLLASSPLFFVWIAAGSSESNQVSSCVSSFPGVMGRSWKVRSLQEALSWL